MLSQQTMEFFTNSIGSFIILWLSSLHILAIGSCLNNGMHTRLGAKEMVPYGMGGDLLMLLQARQPVS